MNKLATYHSNKGQGNISELLTCNSGNASDSKDATSTLYFPTVGHLADSGLQDTTNLDAMIREDKIVQ
jgi:hypothetical protein